MELYLAVFMRAQIPLEKQQKICPQAQNAAQWQDLEDLYSSLHLYQEPIKDFYLVFP